MERLNPVERAVAETASALLARRETVAISAPRGMGSTTTLARLEKGSGGRLREVAASSGIRTTLCRIAAAAAPELFCRQIPLLFDEEGPPVIRPVRIPAEEIETRLIEALAHWTAHVTSTDGPLLLVMTGMEAFSSAFYADRLIESVAIALAGRPVSLLMLGGPQFRLPLSPAMRILPRAKARTSIHHSRRHFDRFLVVTEDEFDIHDIGGMLNNIRADPAYLDLVRWLRSARSFSVDYYSLARLVDLGSRLGGPAYINDLAIDLEFNLPVSDRRLAPLARSGSPVFLPTSRSAPRIQPGRS